MKIFLRSIIAIILIQTISVSAKSQNKDYVITNKGDTLYCIITFPLFSKYGKYQTADATETKQIKLHEIKQFYSAKKKSVMRRIYRRLEDEGSAEFMQLVEQGEINLLQEVTTTYNAYSGISTSTTQWYVSKWSDNVVVIKTSGLSIFFKSRQSRKNDFADLLMDKKEVYDKFIKDNKFSFSDIQNIVHLYNTGEELKKEPEQSQL